MLAFVTNYPVRWYKAFKHEHQMWVCLVIYINAAHYRNLAGQLCYAQTASKLAIIMVYMGQTPQIHRITAFILHPSRTKLESFIAYVSQPYTAWMI